LFTQQQRQRHENCLGFVQQPNPLQNKRLTPVAHGGELVGRWWRGVVLAGRRQIRLGQGLPGDCLGILDVGLGATTSLAALRGAVGLDFPYVVTGRSQCEHHRSSQATRALDSDPVDGHLGGFQQRRQRLDTGLRDPHRQRAHQDAEDVDDRDCRGVFMRVDAGDGMGGVHDSS